MKTKKIILPLVALVLMITSCSTDNDSDVPAIEQTNNTLTVETVSLEDFENLVTVMGRNIKSSNSFFADTCIEEELYRITWKGAASVRFTGFEDVRDDTRLYFENLGLDIALRITPATDSEFWTFNYEGFAPGLICPGSQVEQEVEGSVVVDAEE